MLKWCAVYRVKIMSAEKILEILQREMAHVDLLTEKRQSASSGFNEFLLLKLNDIKLKMYQEQKHKLPHIHIDYGKQHHAASFSIEPPIRIDGTLNKKYDEPIESWLNTNKEILLAIWREAQSGRDTTILVAQLKGNIKKQ